MLKNYFKIAFRNILKYKLHSAINTLGLAIAIACCLLLFLFIKNELSFDSFHLNKDLIYRINYSSVRDGTSLIQAKTQAPLAPVLKKEIPEIQYSTRFIFPTYTVKHGENTFTEKVTFTDPDFLNMFSFNLLRGNPDEQLKDKNTVLINHDIAKKYFGENNPIGQKLLIFRYGVSHNFTVSGVIENAPENSSIQYDILVPFEKLKDFLGDRYFTNWGLFSVRTYIQLSKPSQIEVVTSKIPALIKKYSESESTIFSLQPLSDIHFASTVQETMTSASSLTYSYILAGLSFMILLIAGFNSMNISTALAATRGKEIGVRKVMGAARVQIIIQICCETLILATMAFFLGLLLAELFLPTFNILAGKILKFNFFDDWNSWIWVVIFISGIGLFFHLCYSRNILLQIYTEADNF